MDLSSLTSGVVGVLIGLTIGIVANALLIWVIANYLIDLGEKSPFKKCVICALSLGLVSMVAYACLFIPIPLVNLVAAGVVWYKGSIAAIEGSLEATKGGFTILAICTAVSIGLSWWQMAANAG